MRRRFSSFTSVTGTQPSSPILAIDGIWNLWVLHDQLPKELFRYVGTVTIGAADGPQFLKWR
jgi:hypothetical protein